MPTNEAADLARIIALPSLVASHIGEEVFGEPYVIFPWIAYIEQVIVDAILDTAHERYIVINAPPQTGKSSYVGIMLPFWITGMFPNKNLIYVSYSDDFSVARGKDVAQLHRSYGKRLFGSGIDKNFVSANDWRIAGKRGGMLSVGIGGQITGRPGHVIIIDDLVKNAEEARSKATLQGHVDEWDTTISRRIQPGGTVIMIATRWAENDLTGVLKERMAAPGYEGPQWEFIEFPAFAEPQEDVELTTEERIAWRDIMGREFGEVLDCRFSRIEGRDPNDFFRLQKASMDPYAWVALYQQHPSIREGGLFIKEKWVYESMKTWPLMEEMVRVWDLAATDGGGDFTVGTKVGRGVDGRFYVPDVQRFRKGPGDVQDLVTTRAGIDGFPTAIQIEEEKGGSGRTSTEFFKRMLPMYNVSAAKAEGDKVSRAMPASAMQNKMLCVLPPPEEAPWVKEFVDELGKLMADGRGPRHDDQIDTFAYAMMKLVGRLGVDFWIPGQAPPPRDESEGVVDDPDDELSGEFMEGEERFLTRDPVMIGGMPFYG